LRGKVGVKEIKLRSSGGGERKREKGGKYEGNKGKDENQVGVMEG